MKKVAKSLYSATAQRGSAGREGGSRWVTFQVKLLKTPAQATFDTLWVNAMALPVEHTSVGDTTFLTSFYYSAEPAENEPLVADQNYTGKFRVWVKDKPKDIKILQFSVIEPIMYP
jgi:hypothetical protein